MNYAESKIGWFSGTSMRMADPLARFSACFKLVVGNHSTLAQQPAENTHLLYKQFAYS